MLLSCCKAYVLKVVFLTQNAPPSSSFMIWANSNGLFCAPVFLRRGSPKFLYTYSGGRDGE